MVAVHCGEVDGFHSEADEVLAFGPDRLGHACRLVRLCGNGYNFVITSITHRMKSIGSV